MLSILQESGFSSYRGERPLFFRVSLRSRPLLFAHPFFEFAARYDILDF
jgi:hypothetical protein